MIALISSTLLPCASASFLMSASVGGNELMKRGIQETDSNRLALERLIELFKVALLEGVDICKSSFSRSSTVDRSRSSDGKQSILSASKNICSVRQRPIPSAPSSAAFLASLGSISVGANAAVLLVLISPAHDSAELTC